MNFLAEKLWLTISKGVIGIKVISGFLQSPSILRPPQFMSVSRTLSRSVRESGFRDSWTRLLLDATAWPVTEGIEGLAKFKTYGKQPEEVASMNLFEQEHAVVPPPRAIHDNRSLREENSLYCCDALC